MTLKEIILRLTRGYIKFTGKQPDNLAKLKIQQEALQKFIDSNKVKSLQAYKDKKGIPSAPWFSEAGEMSRTGKDIMAKGLSDLEKTTQNVEPIIKSLDDDVATAQINKLKQDFDFSDRNKVLELLDDIDAGKAFGAFDDIQKKELRDMISTMYTRKPEFASGGLARVGMVGGGPVWKKFIEGLFMKASNDIRLGKGKWAGLTQDQWIKQHDNLTKKLKEWEMSGKKGLPKGAEQYLGMNDLQVSKAIKDATKKVDDEKLMQTAYDEIKGGSGFTDDYKYDADILAEEYAKQHGKVYADLPEDQISIYYDPALKRVSQDLKARMDARKALKDVHQKVELQMFDPKDRKPNASGGIAGQLHLNEGGRVPMIYGGSTGLKAMIKNMIEGINKGRKDKIKTLFPKYSVEEKELLKLGEKYLPRDAATLAAKEIEGKAEGIQVLIDRLKNDKKIIEQMAKNKAMNDPNLDFLMKELEKMENMYPPNLKKYTDIDKDILDMETIKKNLLMKDRKLNAEGGLANILGV